MNESKTMRILKYLLWNTATTGMLVAGTAYGIEGAGNLAIVIAAVHLLAAIFTTNERIRRVESGKKPTLPGWIYAPVELLQAGIAFWYGWWGTGAMLLIAMALCSISYAPSEKKEAQ